MRREFQFQNNVKNEDSFPGWHANKKGKVCGWDFQDTSLLRSSYVGVFRSQISIFFSSILREGFFSCFWRSSGDEVSIRGKRTCHAKECLNSCSSRNENIPRKELCLANRENRHAHNLADEFLGCRLLTGRGAVLRQHRDRTLLWGGLGQDHRLLWPLQGHRHRGAGSRRTRGHLQAVQVDAKSGTRPLSRFHSGEFRNAKKAEEC